MALVLRALRLATALLILAAIVVQLFNPDDPWAVAANFFSFFTIQSNLFAAGVLIAVALRAGQRSPRLDVVRGAATLYLLITGVVFALLLSNVPEDLQLTLPWVDTVLHQLAPILIVLDWLVDPPRARIRPRTALLWLAYPLAWVIYTLIRGAIVNWYPYPFIDVDAHGYPAVLLVCVALSVGFALAALAVAAVGNRLGARRQIAAQA